MDKAQIDTLLREITIRVLDADDEPYDELIMARKAIRSWQRNGYTGPLPYQTELKNWGLLSANHQQENPFIDAREDQALQQAYEDAQAMLKNERYHSACNAFQAILDKIEPETRLAQRASTGHEIATRKLEQTVAPLIQKAQKHTPNHPYELDKQRDLWQEVLQKDPDNLAALNALQELEIAGDHIRIEEEMVRIQQAMQKAVDQHDLPIANRQLGAIQGLAENNPFADLQTELDQLVAELTQTRNDLRQKLGAASTLSVTGDVRDAYIQVREFMNAGVPVMIDAAGLFGQVDGEVDTLALFQALFQETRRRFLSSLISLTQQRRQLADTQKKETPIIAQRTLQDALALLDDEILTEEDREELGDIRKSLEQALALVTDRVRRYEMARELVLRAEGIHISKKHSIYESAQETYPDYRNITQYTEEALEALAAQRVGQIRDKITQIKINLERNDFDKVRSGISQARSDTLAIPKRKRPNGSELANLLIELEQLDTDYINKFTEYDRALQFVDQIEKQLQAYEKNPSRSPITEAESIWFSIPPEWKHHQEVEPMSIRINNVQQEYTDTTARIEEVKRLLYTVEIASSPELFKDDLISAKILLDKIDEKWRKEKQLLQAKICELEADMFIHKALLLRDDSPPQFEHAIQNFLKAYKLGLNDSRILPQFIFTLRQYLQQEQKKAQKANSEQAVTILETCQVNILQTPNEITQQLTVELLELETNLHNATATRDAQSPKT